MSGRKKNKRSTAATTNTPNVSISVILMQNFRKKYLVTFDKIRNII